MDPYFKSIKAYVNPYMLYLAIVGFTLVFGLFLLIILERLQLMTVFAILYIILHPICIVVLILFVLAAFGCFCKKSKVEEDVQFVGIEDNSKYASGGISVVQNYLNLLSAYLPQEY